MLLGLWHLARAVNLEANDAWCENHDGGCDRDDNGKWLLAVDEVTGDFAKRIDLLFESRPKVAGES